MQSYEKNADVIWLRSLNPWSPADRTSALTLTHGDIAEQIGALPSGSFDAILHDPPRFGIAGELYSQAFYDQLARVLKRNGRLFHYTGTPEQAHQRPRRSQRSREAAAAGGVRTELNGDGVLAVRK